MPRDKNSVAWILVAEKHTEIIEKLADVTVKLQLSFFLNQPYATVGLA